MSKLKLWGIVLFTFLSLVITGCAENTSNDTNNDKQIKSTAVAADKATTDKNESSVQNKDAQSFVVYLPTEDARGVKAQTVEAKDNSPKGKLEVLLNSDSQTKYPIFPKAVKINKVTVEDGIANVDFSKEFKAAEKLGTLTNQLELAAIVNTLTEDKDIKGVTFSIEGKTLKTLGEHDLGSSLKRMNSLIIK